MMRRKREVFSILYIMLAAQAFAMPVPTLEWQQMLATNGHDICYGVSGDRLGNLYVAGSTRGSLAAVNANTNNDVFVGKYDLAGNKLWLQQFGTASEDRAFDVAADTLGNIFITGYTRGSLGGPVNGTHDGFVGKYNASGSIEWVVQHGDEGVEFLYEAAADGLGNVFVAGISGGELGSPGGGIHDAILAKYDSTGKQIWTRQLGTSADDRALGLSTDAGGNVYISGTTRGNLDGVSAGLGDGFLGKYDGSGNFIWVRQFGSPNDDFIQGAASDSVGNVFVTGSIGGDDVVMKFDSAGNRIWDRSFGTSRYDSGNALATDHFGNVYIAGSTEGSLATANAGDRDAFVTKLNRNGDLIWNHQFGTALADSYADIWVDEIGSTYIAGVVGANMQDSIGDGIVAKFNEVPELDTACLALLSTGVGAIFLSRPSRHSLTCGLSGPELNKQTCRQRRHSIPQRHAVFA